jgi:hypothetical protein
MAALGADSVRIFGDHSAEFNTLPVLTAVTIYKGSAVGSSGGYARALVAQDLFLGFAEEKVVNAGASGSVLINVKHKGLIQAAVTGATVASINLPVYMSTDNDFTLTSTSNTKVGIILRFVTGTTCIISFSAGVIV